MTNTTVRERPRAARTALAILLSLLMLPNLAWLRYDPSLPVWVEAIVMPAILLLLFFAVLGKASWLGCLLLSPLAMLAPVETYFIALYHHPTSAEAIATVMATNPAEVHEYFGHAIWPIGLGLLLAFAFALWAAWLCFRHKPRMHNRLRAWVLTLAIATPLASAGVAMATGNGKLAQRTDSAMTVGTLLGRTVTLGYPFGVFPRIFQYRSEWLAMRTDAKRLMGYRFGATRETRIPQRQVYVLVIGESSRRNHWQLFGYQRATTPELDRMANLVPITHMVTSWPMSIGAIPLILTRKPVADSSIAFDQASILRAMQEAGFDTWWISNQMPIGQYDSPIAVYAYEAQHKVWLNHASWSAPGSYDGDLVQPLRDALQSSNHDLFIVLHMMGSHLKYDYRYPAAFKRFQPTLSDTGGDAPTGIRMQNSYDNTILYTDHVLAQVIGVLHQSKAVTALWFESDHGEMLVTPTCDLGGHGIGTLYEYEVPAFFWYSNAYAAAFPNRLATLRGNAGKRTMSADTFASLIDMAGVDLPGQDPTRSLFSPMWQYRPRIVNANMWRTDYDKALIGKKCPLVIPP